MKTLELEVPSRWQLKKFPGDIQVKLWFETSPESLNRTWRDAAVRVVDPVDGKVFDSIACREPDRDIERHPTAPCIAFWERVGPLHLVRAPYVTDSRSPWRAIKDFGTLEDFFPDLPDDRPVDGCLLLVTREREARWVALCKAYHDYLTWRTYRAVDLLLGKTVRLPLYSETDWHEDLHALQPGETWERVPCPPSTSEAPDLGQKPEPYGQTRFYELVRGVYDWHRDTGKRMDFIYRAPHRVAPWKPDKPRLGLRQR